MHTIYHPPVRTADLLDRFARYAEVYALATVERGWPPDPWPLP